MVEGERKGEEYVKAALRNIHSAVPKMKQGILKKSRQEVDLAISLGPPNQCGKMRQSVCKYTVPHCHMSPCSGLLPARALVASGIHKKVECFI